VNEKLEDYVRAISEEEEKNIKQEEPTHNKEIQQFMLNKQFILHLISYMENIIIVFNQKTHSHSAITIQNEIKNSRIFFC